MVSIDRLDAAVIGRLTQNARTGIAELAASLGVARNTAQARIRRMQADGVLQGFFPRIGLEAVGVQIQANVALELDQRRVSQVVEALAAIPHVLEVNMQAGRDDLLARIAATTHGELQDVVLHMIDIDGVRHTTTTTIVSTPLPWRTQPLLDHLTTDAGYGRSTPYAPDASPPDASPSAPTPSAPTPPDEPR